MWPDRLTSPRWLNRCRFEGDRKLLELAEDDRGIVLASVHFGPFEILPYWLRAYGIPATSVRADPPAALQSLTNYQYSLSPPADIPVFIFASDLTPVPRFSHIRKILGPGRRLLVMVDPNRGVMADIPFEDRLFHMATGAIQPGTDGGSQAHTVHDHGGLQLEIYHSHRYPSAAGMDWPVAGHAGDWNSFAAGVLQGGHSFSSAM